MPTDLEDNNVNQQSNVRLPTNQEGIADLTNEQHDDVSTDDEEENENNVKDIATALNKGGKVNSDIFDSLDRMRDDIRRLNLGSPQIIVLGDQGAGKSTTLNRSFGYYILPGSRSLCTLCAIRVQFCRGEDFLCSIEVRTREDSKVVEGTHVALPRENFNNISKKVEDAMKKASPDGKIVKDKEIVVTIESKEDPCLDYLDLPGLVSTGNGQDGRVKDIMELARDVLTKEYDKSIILLVVQAQNNGISNSAAAGLIEELDGGTGHYTSRTVGVLTKVDMFVPEEDEAYEDINNLLHGERIGADSKGERYVMRLENGWIGLGSRMSSEITNHETLQTVDAKESAFFSSHEAYKSFWDDGKMGIMSLRDRLIHGYEKMIWRIWCDLSSACMMGLEDVASIKEATH